MDIFKTLNREELLEFISDLAGPIGPEVFAGYGSKLQDAMKNDEFYSEKIKDEWSDIVDITEALDLLFDIASNPPDKTFHNDFYIHYKEKWEFEVTDLLYRVGTRDRKAFLKRLSSFKVNEDAKKIIMELKIWLSEDDG
ncbi:MAG: hypothetical protein GY760_16485 [Deltaproteobacteria bacterium]|nr:hypothetical protein [Deltaproteobacteria bacterium]